MNIFEIDLRSSNLTNGLSTAILKNRFLRANETFELWISVDAVKVTATTNPFLILCPIFSPLSGN
jgi:hypothetical protein